MHHLHCCLHPTKLHPANRRYCQPKTLQAQHCQLCLGVARLALAFAELDEDVACALRQRRRRKALTAQVIAAPLVQAHDRARASSPPRCGGGIVRGVLLLQVPDLVDVVLGPIVVRAQIVVGGARAALRRAWW